jgi:hypothetical protein
LRPRVFRIPHVLEHRSFPGGVGAHRVTTVLDRGSWMLQEGLETVAAIQGRRTTNLHIAQPDDRMGNKR